MKKIKNILFISNAIQFAERTYPFGKRLSERGYNVTYATYSKECINYFKNKGINAIFILNKLLKFYPKNELEHYLNYYEKKYDIPSMNLLILGDKNYARKGRKKALIGLVQHFKYWEDFFSKHKIDVIIGGIERFINEVPRAIIKKNGGMHLSTKIQPLTNSFTLSPDHMGRIYLLEKYWEKNKEKELTKEERNLAEKYIKKATDKKEGIFLVRKPPSINIKNINFFLRRLYVNLFKEKLKNPYADLFKIVKELGVRAIRKRFAKIYYDKQRYDEKFVYYPLHRAADAAVLVRAPQYANQLTLVQNISNHIPIRYKLYIKEHPNGLGEIPLKELKKLKSLTNVKLLSPKMNSHDLIKRAECVFTINSNAGWEALLYQKPVITFGISFYEKSGLVFPLRDFYEFKNIFNKAITNKPDYEQLLKFIVALHKSVTPGKFHFVDDLVKDLKDEKNLDMVTEGIIYHFNQIEKLKSQ